jgi:serine phosphatase RsbU (regulator of sigma subunit)
VVLFNEEMVKSARLQLEVDKLNVKTREDSLLIQKRESEIYFAEQEIKEAKDQIEIQKLVIKQKNTMLMFSISAMLFFVILSIMIYKSWIDKKKTYAILEKNNREIANKNKKIIDSIRYAQSIQLAILPIRSQIDKHFDWFVIYLPKDIVSGDFYWFDKIEEKGKSIFAVVDCTGHGVPGAFMSMIGNRLLIEAVKEKGIIKPVEILNEIDASLRIALMQDETLNNDGMDICICSIESKKNGNCIVEFAGAKRPIFYSDGAEGLKHIKGTVRGIGGKKRIRERAVKPFEEHVLNLHKGDMIYMTTDGFFDLQSSNRKKFGRPGFMEILEKCYTKDVDFQQNALLDALSFHLGDESQIDDITVLGIRL